MISPVGVILLCAVCLLPCLAEPPSAYLPPSAYSTMSQHSFAPPGVPSFGLTAPSGPSSSYSAPSSSYGAPSRTYITPKPFYSAPAPVYSAPKPAPVYSAPSPAPIYSAPRPIKSYLPPTSVTLPKPVYGPAKSSYDDYHSEPAHYNYEYTVNDSHYGTDFGHKEERKGDVTHGQYMVLLPDGRRQIVEYVADKDGYRPTIRYEGTAVKSGPY